MDQVLYNKWVIELCNQEYKGNMTATIRSIVLYQKYGNIEVY